jgi:hypothetical protein
MDDWEVLALLSAVAVFGAHELLHSGLHEEIPLSGETVSVGAGLAVLTLAGIGLNSYVYSET